MPAPGAVTASGLKVPDWLTGTLQPSEPDWLTGRVESGAKLTKERSRAQSMHKHILGRSRIWACDGEYVYFRRKKSNPATLERHNRFMQSGHYKHIQTQDDVEVYQLQDGSPFKRESIDFTEQVWDKTTGSYRLKYNLQAVKRTAILAACGRDWGLFIDALQEIAGRLKGTWHTGMAQLQYNTLLANIIHLVQLRGGPGQVEMDRGVIEARQRRGETRNRVLLMPTNFREAMSVAGADVPTPGAGAKT